MEPTIPKTELPPPTHVSPPGYPLMNSYSKARLPVSGGQTQRIHGITCLSILAAVAMTWLAYGEQPPDNKTHNFVFFAKERELLPNHPFLKIQRFEGAQITYSWKQLEPSEDGYDFE